MYSPYVTKPPRKNKNKAPIAAIVFLIATLLTTIAVIIVIVTLPNLHPSLKGNQTIGGFQATATSAADASLNAPLPTNRIVAAYGIVGGVTFNGPASTLDSLNAFLPQLQDLGQQYAGLDPVHPVKLGIDLVINVIQPCSSFPQWCSSFTDDGTLQAYVDFCQQHNLYLFFDLQLGVMPVKNAIQLLEPYLQKYAFTEVALDTEFHFPNTSEGHAQAAAYPGYLGWMGSDEINWAIEDLAQDSLQHHLPHKVLIVHQWESSVIHDKDKIEENPNVSVVLQSDGWGYTSAKLSKYQLFVQQELLGYGGYKLFYQYDGDTQYDRPLQSPADVMNLFPQPLFISYQ
jgi:hypothetical protein